MPFDNATDLNVLGKRFHGLMLNCEFVTASRTLTLEDSGKTFINDTTSTRTLTIPKDAPVGFTFDYYEYNTGTSNIASASGATNRTSLTRPKNRYRGISVTVIRNVGGGAAEYAVTELNGDIDTEVALPANTSPTFTPGTSGSIQVFNTALTAARTITLAAGKSGDRFMIVRTSAATGAFTLTVGTVNKLLAPGQYCIVVHDGSTWHLAEFGIMETLNYATNGDAALTLDLGYSPRVTRFATTLTADRAVTLNVPSTGAVHTGATFRIVRPASGAFNVNVGTGPLKALAANTWCEVTFDGTAWVLSAYGTL